MGGDENQMGVEEATWDMVQNGLVVGGNLLS